MAEAPYQVGDRLWVREGLMTNHNETAVDVGLASYRRDGELVEPYLPWRWARGTLSPIHMPKEAARIWLEVTAVRCQRVQEISAADVLAEGVSQKAIDDWKEWLHRDDCPGHAFGLLWDSINAPTKRKKRHPGTGQRHDCYVSYPWAAGSCETVTHKGLPWYVIGNPWVFAYTVKPDEEGR